MERQLVHVTITPIDEEYGFPCFRVALDNGIIQEPIATTFLEEIGIEDRYKAVVQQIGTWMIENNLSELTPEVIEAISQQTFVF